MTLAGAPAPHGTALPPGLADDLARAALVLARRVVAGATLWCAAPTWPHHAQHVAVEFVHPVVVGKPAVSAVALPSHDLVTTARANVGSGDVLLVIAPATDAAARALVRRAQAWGATTVWLGAGERPGPGAADSVLWLDDEQAAHDGSLTLLYHLLWELTHVCLEHRGVLAEPPACDGPVCITCSDEGRLGEVVSVVGATAHVRTPTGMEPVDLALVGGASPDDLLVVHAGMAITRVDG